MRAVTQAASRINIPKNYSVHKTDQAKIIFPTNCLVPYLHSKELLDIMHITFMVCMVNGRTTKQKRYE
jgi:hypothetical protein